MINRIIIGMSQALDGEFGDDYSIYKDTVKQGLDIPCFLITNITHTHDAKLCKRYQDNNSFMVQCFPEYSCDQTSVLNGLISRLEDALEWITVDGNQVRETNMDSRIVDGVLNFQVDYNIRTVKQSEEEERMNNMNYKGVV